MPQKNKLKFTEEDEKDLKTGALSEKFRKEPNADGTVGRKKSKKSKAIDPPEPVQTVENEEKVPEVTTKKQNQPVIKLFAFPKLDKEVTGGSNSDDEIPKVGSPAGTQDVCGLDNIDAQNTLKIPIGCNLGKVKLTQSQKVSCLRSDDQEFATADYANATAAYFVPQFLHPLFGQVSSSVRHREFIDYLKQSGFLKKFGTCIMNVYRMWVWPKPERLLEEMLVSMGHPLPARDQFKELTELKVSLKAKIRVLTHRKNEMLKKLDDYEDSRASYELLDQDEVLPPRAKYPLQDYKLMAEIFKDMVIKGDGRDNESSDLKVVLNWIKDPHFNTLPIPYHDKRLLK